MVWANYTKSDDMQDDTYKLIGMLLADAIISYQAKDIERYYADVDSLFCLVWMRLGKEDQERFEKELMRAGEIIYGGDPTIDPEARQAELTRTMDALRQIFKETTKQLDDKGILFKFRASPDELITRGGMH